MGYKIKSLCFFFVDVRYPLYTATSALVGAHVVPYYLDESSTWSVSKSELQHMLKNANSKSIEVRAIVIINPGKVACCVWNSVYFVGYFGPWWPCAGSKAHNARCLQTWWF